MSIKGFAKLTWPFPNYTPTWSNFLKPNNFVHFDCFGLGTSLLKTSVAIFDVK
jgi:hypothetical protein